jgi:uncharacterized protein YdaU (DUF1376 family)
MDMDEANATRVSAAPAESAPERAETVPYESPKYFPFYHRDFMDGVREVSAVYRGGYISLLCHQWDKRSIPGDDINALALIMGTETRAEAKKVWAKIGKKFIKGDDGGWRNARLEEVRQEVEAYFAKQAANGKKGGRPRQSGKPDGTDGKPMGKPTGSPRQSHTNTNSATSSLTSDLPDQQLGTSEGSSDRAQNLHPVTTVPSGSQPNPGVHGWEVWILMKAWIATDGNVGPITLRLIELVYAAHVTHNRLELVFERLDEARYCMANQQLLLADALRAVGQGELQIRAIAKPKPAQLKARVG